MGQRERCLANNTVRARLTAAMSFLRWCRENDLPALDPSRIARLARRYPKVYGKVQGHRPARWLTREEAYGRLVPACQDGTELGLRDELAIRLGLAGIRAAEIGSLRIGNLALAHTPPTIDWTGKARRPRHATIGREMLAVIHRYLAAYETAMGRPLRPSDPFLCRRLPGGKRGTRLMWGRGWADPAASVWDTVTRRASLAGLGHVAPHDLRRTAAGILHRAVNENGAHYFDLLDIQKVLGHADPATTMKSYLDPMDNGVYDRAANFLD